MKQRGWTARLVVNDVEAAIVRRIFETYDELDIGLRGIAIQLNADGSGAAAGWKWAGPALRNVITNPTYRGDYVYGRYRYGKYHYATKEGVQARERRKDKGKVMQVEEECVVLKDHHEAIIPRDLWERVQRKLSA